MAILLFIYSINACLLSTVRDIGTPSIPYSTKVSFTQKHDYTRYFLMLSKLHLSNGKKKKKSKNM